MPKKRTGRPPGRDREATPVDPVANMLHSLTDGRTCDRQRASNARFLLKHGTHTVEALACLREILANPDESIRRGAGKGLEMVRRSLIKFGTPTLAYDEPVWLPKEFEGLVSTSAIVGEVVWTDDMRLVDRSMSRFR